MSDFGAWTPLSETGAPASSPEPPKGNGVKILLGVGCFGLLLVGAIWVASMVFAFRDYGDTLEGPVAVFDEALPPVPAEPLEDGLFITRTPASKQTPRPPRFDAPWPTAPNSWGSDAPPRGWAEARLCAGDDDAWARWEESLRAASGTSEQIVRTWSWMVEYCGGVECERLEPLLSEPDPVGAVAKEGRSFCDSPPEAPAPPTGAVAEMLAALQEAGLIPADAVPKEAVEDDADAAWLLYLYDVGYWFDPETGIFPNQHDNLLATLAHRAGPPFDQILFWEDPPRDIAGGKVEVSLDVVVAHSPALEHYVLHAWLDGVHYSADAYCPGDWSDVDAVLGLLNGIARARGLPTRFLQTYGSGNDAQVLAMPKETLLAAQREGLIDPPGAGTTAAAQAAEAEIIRQMLESGEIGLPAPE